MAQSKAMHKNAPGAKVNMTYVAKVANVHQGTVSRALRNDPRIAKKTREHIKKIAEELGYRPNPLVSALIAEKKKGRPSGYGSTLAFLTSGETREFWRESSPKYAAMREHLREHAYKRGYNLEDFWINESDMSPQRMRQILQYRSILGIIVCPLPGDHSTINFDFSDFASVAIGYTLRDPVLDHVSVDYYIVMKRILKRMHRRYGFKRIGFTTSRQISIRVHDLSLSAYLSEHFENKSVIRAPLVYDERLQKEDFIPWFEAEQPEVIICPTHAVCIQITRMLKLLGKSVPDDVSIVSADCHTDNETSGILQDLDAEASAVIELLTNRVEHGIFGIPTQPQTILVSGTWRDGNTVKPKREAVQASN